MNGFKLNSLENIASFVVIGCFQPHQLAARGFFYASIQSDIEIKARDV